MGIVEPRALSSRRSVRLAGYDYSQRGVYFLTICAHERRCLFGDIVAERLSVGPIGVLVQATWDGLPVAVAGVETDAFVVMPNHVHGVVVLTGMTPSTGRAPVLGEVVRGFKARVTRGARVQGLIDGPVWQGNYYEHVIRDEEDLERVRRYIDENPQAWALDPERPS